MEVYVRSKITNIKENREVQFLIIGAGKYYILKLERMIAWFGESVRKPQLRLLEEVLRNNDG